MVSSLVVSLMSGCMVLKAVPKQVVRARLSLSLLHHQNIIKVPHIQQWWGYHSHQTGFQACQKQDWQPGGAKGVPMARPFRWW